MTDDTTLVVVKLGNNTIISAGNFYSSFVTLDLTKRVKLFDCVSRLDVPTKKAINMYSIILLKISFVNKRKERNVPFEDFTFGNTLTYISQLEVNLARGNLRSSAAISYSQVYYNKLKHALNPLIIAELINLNCIELNKKLL